MVVISTFDEKLKFREFKDIIPVRQLVSRKCWSQEDVCLSASKINTLNCYAKLKRKTIEEIKYPCKPGLQKREYWPSHYKDGYLLIVLIFNEN